MTFQRKLALLVGTFLLLPVVSQATSCVDGVDCFCDTVSPPNGSTVIMCEDFQASGLYEGGSGNWVQSQPGGERGAHRPLVHMARQTRRGQLSRELRDGESGEDDQVPAAAPSHAARRWRLCARAPRAIRPAGRVAHARQLCLDGLYPRLLAATAAARVSLRRSSRDYVYDQVWWQGSGVCALLVSSCGLVWRCTEPCARVGERL